MNSKICHDRRWNAIKAVSFAMILRTVSKEVFVLLAVNHVQSINRSGGQYPINWMSQREIVWSKWGCIDHNGNEESGLLDPVELDQLILEITHAN